MGKRATTPSKPARTVEQREAQMINLALELAEKQLREGTAPATTVNHYLKLASTREQLEVEKLRNETELLKAKKAPSKLRRQPRKPSRPFVSTLEREMLRTYTELSRLETFEERFDYLALTGQVGTSTFGFDRYLNQRFYSSTEWKKVRNFVLARDEACDLGIEGLDIRYMPLIHHMNPIQPRDLEEFNPDILEPEFLITTCKNTHNAIHFGDRSRLTTQVVERRPNDQAPWRI